MSAPHRKRTRAPKRPGLSRRGFLRGLGLGGATLTGASLVQGCGGSNPTSAAENEGPITPSNDRSVQFLHGVASGDPLFDRVILWTRVTPATSETPANMDSLAVQVNVFTDEALNNFVGSVDTTTSAARDFTVKIDFGGLTDDTVYFYQFRCNGVDSPIGRTQTAPRAGVKRPVNLGLVSCSSLAHGFFNAYDLLAEREDLDAIVHLGDYIYEYGTNEYGSVRPYEPSTEIISLQDYRTRHAQYKKDTDLQKLHAQYPFITIWDDHESANNAYRDGAENHNEGEGDWVTRKEIAQQVYDEWMPIRLPEANNPGKIFRRVQFGDMADLTLLDTRLYDRDLEASTPINPLTDASSDPDRTMIGQEQYDFLMDGLRASNAKWKLIGNQVVFHQWIIKPGLNNPTPTPVQDLIAPSGLNGDAWDAYSAERQKIINALRGDDGGASVNNVVFLTGDVHSAWVADITDDPNNLAAYNPVTGDGSVATEFVVTSITSPGLPIPDEVVQAIRVSSPHIKHVKMSERGYSILRLSEEKAVCEYWAISGIEQPGAEEAMSARFEVADQTNRITGSTLPSIPGA